jgi:RimJ/RimL family protein N-acetyltransferase
MTIPAERLRYIGAIILAIAVVSSLGAALAVSFAWDVAASPLISLSAHAWMGWLISLALGFYRGNGAPRPGAFAGLAGFETARCRLTPLLPADAPSLQALTDHPAITGAISFLSAPFAMADAQALIAIQDGGADVFFGVWRRGDGVLLGVSGAHLPKDAPQGKSSIEIGYWIGAAHGGQGYATEVVRGLTAHLGERLPGHEIFAECRRENAASWRVLLKCGFQPTEIIGSRPGRRKLIWAPGGF